jgi:Ca-activated chloride channel family protein
MKFNVLFKSQKFARLTGSVLLGAILVCGTVAKTMSSAEPVPTPIPVVKSGPWKTGPGLKARAQLSQDKVLVGSDGRVYLQIDVESDGSSAAKARRMPTDFVVVLDRSGSMMDGGKMDYAHRAIESLLRQMNADDRFALVSFDDVTETSVELTPVGSDNLNRVIAKVKEVVPRGGTNLGGGLAEGMRLVKSLGHAAGRAERVLLLSDGLANVGVTDPNDLNKMADQAVAGEFVVSTIGLGLDFNETLMSSLADHGAGNYHFLESMAGLDSVIAGEFNGAGMVAAANLELELDLASGVQVIDASGYPVERKDGSYVVHPGQLYDGQKKAVYVTLQLPTAATYSEALGRVELGYKAGGADRRVSLLAADVKIACLPAEKKADVASSINKPVYENAWTQNNYGQFLKGSADDIREGNSGGALQALGSYRSQLQAAYEVAPSPKMAEKLDELEAREEEIKDAFSGSDAVVKQKRLSKTQDAMGSEMQRK